MRLAGVLLTGVVVLLVGLVVVGAFAAAPLTTLSGTTASGPLTVTVTGLDTPSPGEHPCHGPAQQDVDHAASALPARSETASDNVAPLPKSTTFASASTGSSPVGADRRDCGDEGEWLAPTAPALQVFRI